MNEKFLSKVEYESRSVSQSISRDPNKVKVDGTNFVIDEQ